MVEQDRPQQIKEATEILNRQSGMRPRSHSGYNRNGFRKRALGPLGLCGGCANLNLLIINHNEVEVDCFSGRSPLNLQMMTPPGEKANCDKFKPLEK